MEKYVAEKFMEFTRYTIVYQVSSRNAGEKGEKYALKRAFLSCSTYIKRLLCEKKVLEKISSKPSPLLPILHDAFWMGTSASLVMTAGSGLDLLDLLLIHNHLSEESAQFYAAEILCGLEHLHSLKIVHVDIKPANVLISRNNHVMITDFDHSLDISEGPTSHPLKCRGTDFYNSPEVARLSIIDEKADIWSWASILVELVDAPVRSTHLPDEILRDVAESGIINMKSHRSYSSALKTLLESCFKIDSSSRASIQDIKDHEFFETINWADAANCCLIPPIRVTEFDVERIKSAWEIDTYNPLILNNLHESEMINIHERIKASGGSYTFGKLKQYSEELRNAGFTKSKLEELFSDFNYSPPDTPAANSQA